MPGAENGHAVTDRRHVEEISFLKQSFDGIAEQGEGGDFPKEIIRARAPQRGGGAGGGSGKPVLKQGSSCSLDTLGLEPGLASVMVSAGDARHSKSSNAAADEDAFVPPRLTRMRSSSLPDISKAASPDKPSVAASAKSERVSHMRKALAARGYGEDVRVFSDAYIMSVMLAHKDGKQRTFEYALEKLAESLQWRRDFGAAAITAADVRQSLAPGHMYWEGRDVQGRPILWVRPAQMDLATYDRDQYFKAHVYLLEQGLELMKGEVTCFVLVADSSGLSQKHMDSKLMRDLLKVAQVAYPDRLGALVVGPVNMIVRGAWVLLSRLMSKRLAEKISLVQSPRAHLKTLLPRTEKVPEWLA